jgi:hypothetical protein
VFLGGCGFFSPVCIGFRAATRQGVVEKMIPLTASKPISWLRCPLQWLQGFDAEQVGQDNGPSLPESKRERGKESGEKSGEKRTQLI